MFRKAVLILSIAATPVAAQVQVEVPEPGMGGAVRQGAPAAAPAYVQEQPMQAPAPASNPTGELFNQIQRLQQEVMTLRGIVEEQGEQIRQLRQQRLDDYMSLDRRLSAMGTGAAATGGGAVTMNPSAGGAPAVAPGASTGTATPAANPAVEDAAYKAAYEKVKNRDFAGANTAFNEFLAKYPEGDLAGNAHYWLAELYLLEGDSTTAKRHFEALVNDHPSNSKVADGMFKLGRIYHQDGDKEKAKEILQRVVSDYRDSGSSAPRLAEEYLRQNF